MSTAAGPRLKGARRDTGMVLSLDARNILSYLGDPTTNASASYDSTLGQAYDWTNSGGWTRTNNVKDVGKPSGYENVNVYVCKGVTTSVGSQHFGMGRCNASATTTYSASMWYRQNKQGVGGPYLRTIVGNASLGSLVWVGYDGLQSISGSSNWPANEWIKLRMWDGTTGAGETGLYISNYIGSAVGDTAWCFGPQIEALDYNTPLVLNSDADAATATRGTSDTWKDLSANSLDADLINGADIGTVHWKKGFVTAPLAYSSDKPALDFDGSDDYVEVPNNSAFLTAKTWELWVNFDSFPASSTYDSVFQKSPNWNYADTIGMNQIYGNFRWSFGHHWGGAIFDALSSLSTGVWYHAVGTVDMADPTMTSRTYLNGVAKGTQTNPYTDRPTNTNTLQIGTGNGGPFNGKIAVFNVYQEELTAGQVLHNFNSMRSRFKV